LGEVLTTPPCKKNAVKKHSHAGCLLWRQNNPEVKFFRGVYKVLLGNRRERDHWGDLGVDGWIMLGWISRRWDVGIWTWAGPG